MVALVRLLILRDPATKAEGSELDFGHLGPNPRHIPRKGQGAGEGQTLFQR